MLYIEMQLDGKVKAYELSDYLLLTKITVETHAAFLPIPDTTEEAHDYLRSTCFQLEMFETYEHAASWAASYDGFRAGEVRAELRRFDQRRAQAPGRPQAAA